MHYVHSVHLCTLNFRKRTKIHHLIITIVTNSNLSEKVLSANVYNMDVPRLSVANQEFDHLETPNKTPHKFGSVLSATKFSAPWGKSPCHNKYVLEELCTQRVRFQKCHSHGWRWNILGTFPHTFWFVLAHLHLYNFSFRKDNSSKTQSQRFSCHG